MPSQSGFWESPDKKIKKQIIVPGVFGKKPIENSKCDIQIIVGPSEIMQLSSVTIGQQDTKIGHLLDICLMTMNKLEEAAFNISDFAPIRLLLNGFSDEKYIFQLSGKEKFDLAHFHKNAGVTLYKNEANKDAAIRFIKALKILHSIPLDVEKPFADVDGISVEDINKMKGTLYNNLSSCYFKNKSWQLVIDICNKALLYDSDNVKSLYKLAVSYKNERDYEKSYLTFQKVIDLEPNNKACTEHIKFVIAQMNESKKRVNELLKNMFKDSNA